MLLMILRHGKAEKEAATRRDADRALAERGRRQAEFIGRHLAAARGGKGGLARPEVVLASRAERAKTTAMIVADALGLKVEFEDALSLGNGVREAMKLVRRVVEAGEPVLLVGHNPQLSELASKLGGEEVELRTGEMVVFEVAFAGEKRQSQRVAALRLDGDED